MDRAKRQGSNHLKQIANLYWLLRQADSRAKCSQPRITAQKAGMFTIHTEQEPADSDRPKLGGAIKRLENSVLIAYASEGRGLAGSAGKSCRFLCFFMATSARIGTRKRGFNRSRIGRPGSVVLNHLVGLSLTYQGAGDALVL